MIIPAMEKPLLLCLVLASLASACEPATSPDSFDMTGRWGIEAIAPTSADTCALSGTLTLAGSSDRFTGWVDLETTIRTRDGLRLTSQRESVSGNRREVLIADTTHLIITDRAVTRLIGTWECSGAGLWSLFRTG
jgi:hypothetical protein